MARRRRWLLRCPGRALVGRQGLAARRLSHGRRWSLQLQIDPPQKLSNPDRRHCWRNARGHEPQPDRSEEHTSELQSLMRTSYAVFCLKKKHTTTIHYLI